jgi:hypothetical protein
MHQVAGKGMLVNAAILEKRKAASLTQDVSKAMLRGSFTHVTMICDDGEAQRLLPQILIVNKHMVTELQQRTLSATMPANVLLLRRHTAWMTSELMVRLLLVLKQSLAPFKDTHQIFLTADAYRAHVTSEVWKQCVRQKILYCVIPAKLTWDSATGKLSLEVLLQGVCQCIVEILEGRSWAKAFADTGLTGTQAGISARVQTKLTFERIPEVGCELPTLANLVDVFPKRAVLPIDNMFGMFLTPSIAEGPHRMPHAIIPVDPEIPDDMQPGPITRSRAASRTTLLGTLSQEPCPGPRLMHLRPRLQLRQLPRLARLPRVPAAATDLAELPTSSPLGQSAASNSGHPSHA